MKIYFDYDNFNETTSPCPHGMDCMVGSVFCAQCRNNVGIKRRACVPAIFFIENKASLRNEDYVECCFGEELKFTTFIKKLYYKLFN